MSKIINLFDVKSKYQAINLIILMTLASILELLGIGFVILVLNSFLGINDIYPSFIETLLNYFSPRENHESVHDILFLIFVIFTIKLLIVIFVSFKENSFHANFREKITNKMYHNFLNRNVLSLLKKNSAIYLRNFTEELNLSMLFFVSLLKIILDFIILFAFLTFLLFFNITITLSVFFIFTLIGIVYFYNIKDKLSSWAISGLQNRKKRIQFINESFLAIKSIKILSQENFFFKKLQQENRIFRNISFKVNFLKSIPPNFFEYILLVSILILFFYLIGQNFSDEKIIQILSVYALVSFRIVPIINRVIGNSQHLRYTYPSVKKLVTEIDYKIIKKKSLINKINFKKSIKLKFKHFSFSQLKKPLFKNFSLEIKKNSKIGIIGPSGSGKSTIIDIICGFRNFENGIFKVDDKNVYNDIESWQKTIGYIPQNIVIFNDTLRNNILFGSDRKKFSDKIINRLIDKVELNYLLKSSSKGLSQIISQDGQNISGGEKQRIGIARALINNPEIIILDEATSGLDVLTEKNVLSTIRRLNKTVIIVSHRLSALSFCDKIYLVQKNTLKNLNINSIKKFF